MLGGHIAIETGRARGRNITSALRAACAVEGRDVRFRLKTEQGMYCGVWTMDVALRADSGLIDGHWTGRQEGADRVGGY